MALNDWNHNGMYDSSDRYSDYRMSGGGNNNSGGGGLGVIGIALYHNSYVLNGLNERVFTNDWHIQSPQKIKSVGKAIKEICEYTYNSYHSQSTLEKRYCRKCNNM